MKASRPIVLASLAFVLALAPRPAAAQGALALDPAFAPFESGGPLRGLSASGADAAPAFRQSIDVDVVVAVIRDRAQQAAVRAVADVLGEAARSALASNVATDILADASALLSNTTGVDQARVRAIAWAIVRAALGDALIRARFPTGTSFGSGSDWPATPGITWRPRQGDDPALLRLHLVEWAYWWLGSLSDEAELFPRSDATASDASPSRSSGRMPECPRIAASAGRELCQQLTEADVGRRRAWIAELLRLSLVVDGIELAGEARRTLSTRTDSLDLRALLEAVARSRVVARLGSAGDAGLRLEQWLSVAQGAGEAFDALASASGPLSAFAVTVRALGATAPTALTPERSTELSEGARGALAHLRQYQDAYRLLLDARFDPLVAGLEQAAAGGAWPAAEAEQRARFASLSALLPVIDGINRTRLGLQREKVVAAVASIRAGVGTIRQVFDAARAAAPGDARADAATLDVGAVATARLPDLLAGVASVVTGLGNLSEAAAALGLPSAVAPDGPRALLRAARRLHHVIELLHTASAALRDPSLSLDGVRERLGALVGSQNQEFVGMLLDLLEPVMDAVRGGRRIDDQTLFTILQRVDAGKMLAAVGLADTAGSVCDGSSDRPACWVIRAFDALKQSIRREEGRLFVDGSVFVRQLASVGDTFRRRNRVGGFFHLAIGLGFESVLSAPGGPAGEFRPVPLVAEQLGFGLALPSWADGRVTLKFGAFGSGLLYRLVMDSRESDAIMAGGFVAVDLYEILELFVAPHAIFYPPTMTGPLEARFGLSFGVQVPLGDYLSRL